MAITAFLSRSPGLLNRGPGDPAPLGYVPHSSIFSPTYWTSRALSYIIVWLPPSSCGPHKSHSFNSSTVKVIFWYFSTGCTCYLHRCISYFDSLAGSEVSIQHMKAVGFLEHLTILTKSSNIQLFQKTFRTDEEKKQKISRNNNYRRRLRRWHSDTGKYTWPSRNTSA